MDPAHLIHITEQKLLCFLIPALFQKCIKVLFQRFPFEEFQSYTLFLQGTLVQFQTFL